METLKKKPRFKHKESEEHLYAKNKYADVLRKDWVHVHVEKPISREGFFYFTPDIVVYDHDGIAGFYEIVFTHDVDLHKMNRMWNFANDCMRPLFLKTIKADNVMIDNYVFMMNVML